MAHSPVDPQEKPHLSVADRRTSETTDKSLEAGTAIIILDGRDEKFRRLGWKNTTLNLMVEAIAVGCLSLPKAFSELGMCLGVTSCVFFGLVAMYTGYSVGQMKIRHPEVMSFADSVGISCGRIAEILAVAMTVSFLVLLVGSHVLVGKSAFGVITGADTCAINGSIVAAVLLFLVALPTTFHKFSWLGYIDFTSIMVAIIITIASVASERANAPKTWTPWLPEYATFNSVELALLNIIFSYSFTVCQYAFMAEMHTPTDFKKSLVALGGLEITVYTLTGSMIYYYVGEDARSPALLSAGGSWARIAFGVALPVIVISGSIDNTVCGRFILDRYDFPPDIKNVKGRRGMTCWVALIAALTLVAWVIAESIPFFAPLLGIMGALLISGFSFYFPALFCFVSLREGPWNGTWRNRFLSAANAALFLFGMVVLVGGTYVSVQEVVQEIGDGVGSPWSCNFS